MMKISCNINSNSYFHPNYTYSKLLYWTTIRCCWATTYCCPVFLSLSVLLRLYCLPVLPHG